MGWEKRVRRSHFLRQGARGTGGLILALGIPSTFTACQPSAPPRAASVVETIETFSPAPLSEPVVWRVAIAQGLRPFAMEQGDVLVGFDLDLIKAIAEVCNATLKLERQPFDALTALIQAGQIDLAMGAVPITPERSAAVDFSLSYFHSGVTIVALPKNNQLSTLKALTGKKIAVTLGTAGAQLAIDVLGSTILTFNETTAALTAVKAGEADLALVALPTLLYIQSTQADYADLQRMGKLIDDYDFGIVVRSEAHAEDSSDQDEAAQADSDSRLKAVNAALRTLVRDGTYAEIYERWLGTAPIKKPF